MSGPARVCGVVPDRGRRVVYRDGRDRVWPWRWMVRAADGRLFSGEARSWALAMRASERVAGEPWRRW